MKHFKLLVGIFLIIIGVVAFIFGFKLDHYHGRAQSPQTYGGDAYTGIQNASAATSENTNELIYEIKDVYQLSMNFAGIVFTGSGILVAIYDLASNKKIETKSKK